MISHTHKRNALPTAMTRALIPLLVGVLAAGCAPRMAPAPATGSQAVVARTQTSSPGAVVLVRTPRHLLAALSTARDGLADHSGLPRYRILACGEGVLALRAGSEAEGQLREAKQLGVRVSACGMSLAEQHVQASDLSEAVDVVPNAIAEALRLQSLGWVSVEL